MKRFAFVLWNPKTKKVSMDIFKAENIKDAMEKCVQFYQKHGNWILVDFESSFSKVEDSA